jgi:four helix bundle protein
MATKTERQRSEKRKLLRESCLHGFGPALDHRIVTLTKEIYRVTRLLEPPARALGREELVQFDWSGLGQLNRAVTSIAANYVEGVGKCDPVDFLKFLRQSRGSAYEAVYWAEVLELEIVDKIRVLAGVVDSAILELLDSMGDLDIS